MLDSLTFELTLEIISVICGLIYLVLDHQAKYLGLAIWGYRFCYRDHTFCGDQALL